MGMREVNLRHPRGEQRAATRTELPMVAFVTEKATLKLIGAEA